MTATASDLKSRLNSAVTAHSLWKQRLADAVQSGGQGLDAAQLEKDNLCELGKWLYASPEHGSHPHYEKVRQLHAEFHRQAAAVLRMGLKGQTAAALQCLRSSDSDYVRVSASLVLELSAWKKSL
ncbi:MAG: CZB domain-containing protein [Bryobacteraceae bacterium]|nr:CZB domain-containing protein [Bryobacteraceae bacterium]